MQRGKRERGRELRAVVRVGEKDHSAVANSTTLPIRSVFRHGFTKFVSDLCARAVLQRLLVSLLRTKMLTWRVVV